MPTHIYLNGELTRIMDNDELFKIRKEKDLYYMTGEVTEEQNKEWNNLWRDILKLTKEFTVQYFIQEDINKQIFERIVITEDNENEFKDIKGLD